MLAKNINITYIFDQRNSFNNLIHSSRSSTFESPQKKTGNLKNKTTSYTNVCLKFFYDAKLITPLLIFYSLVKIQNENSIV